MATLSLGVWVGWNDVGYWHNCPLVFACVDTNFVQAHRVDWKPGHFICSKWALSVESLWFLPGCSPNSVSFPLKPGFPYKLPDLPDLPGQPHLPHLPLHQPHHPSGVPDLLGLTLTCLHFPPSCSCCILCVAHSYSDFKILFEYHLLLEAFSLTQGMISNCPSPDFQKNIVWRNGHSAIKMFWMQIWHLYLLAVWS